MMAEKLCPVCQRPNDANAQRCWYCQAELSVNEKPSSAKGTDWLNGLREDSEQTFEPELPQPVGEPEKPEEVPDWLARIRTREQMDREAQAKNQSTEQPESSVVKKEDIPDWLKEIKAGYSGRKSEAEQQEPEEESVSPFAATPSSQQPTTGMESQGDDTDEWLSRLAAWKPAEETEQPAQEGNDAHNLADDTAETSLPPLEAAPPSQFDLDSLAALHQSEFRPFEQNRGDGWAASKGGKEVSAVSSAKLCASLPS
jgi:hypothetical protein